MELRRQPRAHRRLVVAGVLLALLSPVFYSYASTMVQPSSLPLGVRTVEWVRNHHGHWLVDEAERIYYGWWKAPAKGGPQLRALPAIAVAQTATPRLSRRREQWPRPIAPVFPHRLPGEGLWRGTGPTVDGRPPVEITTFRTERDYPRLVAYVAWFDHTRTSLAWYPGRYEPPSAPVRGSASVPPDQRWRLLATFNGGFTHIDGNNGSAVDGHTDEPLRAGLATLGLPRRTRRHRPVERWPRRRPDDRLRPPEPAAHRLERTPQSEAERQQPVGLHARKRRPGLAHRSGIDRRGNIIYAAANDQTVRTLAEILQRAGAIRAMQFDINPEWPSLITYRHHHGIHPREIVPNAQQSAWRYLVPDDRDFVAVYRRLRGPVTVPLK